MARARDLLERFRPIGAPGAAGPLGVPADRGAERARELQPVFDLLADVVAESTRIRTAARAEAARQRDAAALEAARIVDAARRDAPVVRAATAARAMRQGAGQVAAVLEQGEREAAALAALAQQRMGDYLERVVGTVRDWPAPASGERAP